MFALWKKEFEDLFPIDELYECFQTEFETIGKTIKDLETLLASDCKFSEALSGITKLSKPQIWVRLADYYKNKTLPSDVKSIVDSINNLS
jgi:antitoxin component HigA of HigAB toxin-antitoxin module